jgi:hypothetical protein
MKQFFYPSSRKIFYAFKKVFIIKYGFYGGCFMGDEIPGATTHFLWDHYDGKIPAKNIVYDILCAPEDEGRARIIIPVENILMTAKIEPLTSR